MYKRILVPLDGSELAERIVPHVEAIAKGTGAETILLRITDPMHATIAAEAPAEARKWLEFDQAKAAKYLEGVAKRLQDAGLRTKLEVAVGEPAVEILTVAEKEDVDLIAIGWNAEKYRWRMPLFFARSWWTRGRRARARVRRLPRQVHRERRARARLAPHPDRPPVGLDDLAHDPQAQPEATIVALAHDALEALDRAEGRAPGARDTAQPIVFGLEPVDRHRDVHDAGLGVVVGHRGGELVARLVEAREVGRHSILRIDLNERLPLPVGRRLEQLLSRGRRDVRSKPDAEIVVGQEANESRVLLDHLPLASDDVDPMQIMKSCVTVVNADQNLFGKPLTDVVDLGRHLGKRRQVLDLARVDLPEQLVGIDTRPGQVLLVDPPHRRHVPAVLGVADGQHHGLAMVGATEFGGDGLLLFVHQGQADGAAAAQPGLDAAEAFVLGMLQPVHAHGSGIPLSRLRP